LKHKKNFYLHSELQDKFYTLNLKFTWVRIY